MTDALEYLMAVLSLLPTHTPITMDGVYPMVQASR